MDFKVGDVVVLKSGGPKMTIEKIEQSNSNNTDVKCVWFNHLQGGDEQLKDGKFVSDTLKSLN